MTAVQLTNVNVSSGTGFVGLRDYPTPHCERNSCDIASHECSGVNENRGGSATPKTLGGSAPRGDPRSIWDKKKMYLMTWTSDNLILSPIISSFGRVSCDSYPHLSHHLTIFSRVEEILIKG